MDDLSNRLDSLSPAKRQLLLERLRRKAAEESPAVPPLTPVPRPAGGAMPLSFGQQQLWVIEQLAPGGALYNVPAPMAIDGPLDVPALAAALAGLVERHETLRTRFVRSAGEPRQIVIAPAPVPALPMLDLSALPAGPRDAEALCQVMEEMRRPFDLTGGLLLRALLLRLAPSRHLLLLDLHHIASDGWSVGVLIGELAALYAARRGGRTAVLPELPIQYADYAWYQRQWLQGERLAELLGYWRERFAAPPPPLPLPFDRPRPPVRSPQGRLAALSPDELPAGLAAALARLGAGERGATLFVTLLAGLQALLCRVTGQTDVVVGTAVANRQRPEIEGLIGYFVNTLALRTDVAGDPTFRELLGRARDTAVDAFAHQELPFEKLVEELRPERDPSLTPLFQVSLALQEAPLGLLEVDGLTLSPLVLEDGPGTAKFDLAFSAVVAGGRLVLNVQYAAALFDATTVRRLLGCYARLLAAAAADPGRPVSELPLLADSERHQVEREWNDTAGEAEGLPVHLQVLAIARRAPGAPAIADPQAGSSPWTYGELEARSGFLAELLRSRGIGAEDRVAIYLERSAVAVAAMLAVLRAGAAFVPLDPGHPAERLAYVMEDSGSKVLLTRRPLLAGLPQPPAVEVFCLDEIGEGRQAAHLRPAPVMPALPESLCYVFYTSGTTGRPKGVAVEHRALANLTAWKIRAFPINARDRHTYLFSPSFDPTMSEIWPCLAAGACLEVVEDEVRLSPAALLHRLSASAVTLCEMPTPLGEALLAALEGMERWPAGLALRLLATGGDRLRRVPRQPLPFTLANVYGPTENTVISTMALVDGEAAPPIGRPVANVRMHILDARLRPVPIGVAGELYAAGAGLARGYLGQPGLTAARFVPDPWSDAPGGRLYATGDRARLLADGRIDFLGRADRQVKIRGFRVEPGEVEAVLAGHPAVRACAVLAREAAGGTALVAYVESTAEAGELAASLRERLPLHMVPSSFVFLESLPSTPNGKIDRQALLRLPAGPAPAAAVSALRTRSEETVAGAWREVLGVQAVGPDDNFFDLGGHSMLLVQLHERLQPQFPGLEVLDLFRHPTVSALAAFLDQRAAGASNAATPEPEATVPATAPAGTPRGTVRGAVPAGDAVAVIGMAGRFPGARDVEELWDNLVRGVEAVRILSPEELIAAGADAETAADPGYVRAVAACDDADWFDAPFFGLSPREAEATDPQHRLFLECAWQALEHAGYDPAAYRGRIGVYGGAGLSGYEWNLYSNQDTTRGLGIQAKVAIDKDFLATRVSYKLGLTGPSLTVQTACSTSLVAVHLACRALLNGECDMALAGGVSLQLSGIPGYSYEEGGILSPDGHCRAFDAAAKGTVPGQGAGIVLLKRLADALADGDPVDAVIRGSAINNDGSLKIGYTAPAIDGQTRVIQAALAAAGVEPRTISYVEAHGTGTPLGDPIEVAALRQAFGDTAGSRCALGSLKSNIGHLDTAAGVAGLIKTVMALRHGTIPPSLHFERPNPQIDFAGSPFHVAATALPWPAAASDGPRRAGVSSFGIGGTNAHVVLEEAPALPAPPAPPATTQDRHLLVLSARSAPALERAAADLAAWLARHPDLDPADVAWTLQTGRRAFDHRRAVLCRNLEEARVALAGGDPGRVLDGVASVAGGGDRPVAFLFPGQGAQRAGMARGLYAAHPVFRAELDRAAELLRPHLELDLRDLLFPPEGAMGEAAARLAETRFTQPALFAVEHALARLWMSWGIEPWALLGHSVGEYVAACLAGVFALDDALALIALRGRLVQALPPGSMLGVPLPAGEIEALLGAELSLAAVNASDRSVVSGPTAAVDELRRRLAGRGIEGRPLATSHAFHSAMMEPAVDALAAAVAGVPRQLPRLPWLSNVTGTWISPDEATDPAYWGRHLRAPVRFADGVGELLARPGVLLEVGPGETLGRLARRELRRRSGPAPVILSSLPPGPDPEATASDAAQPLDEAAHLLRAAGRLWLAGARLDWRALQAGESRRRVHLPSYPFERRRYWLEPRSPSPESQAAAPAPAGERQAPDGDPAGWFYLPSWKRSLPPAPAPAGEGGAGAVLVFLDDKGLGEGTAARLRAAGRSVATVRPGKAFADLGGGAYALRPGEAADYDALLAALPSEGREVAAILHLWSFGAAPALPPVAAGSAVDRAFYSPLFLAQALERRRADDRRLDLWLVSSHLHDVSGGEPVIPERALLLGPAKVIPLELPGVVCHSLDLEAGGRVERTIDRLWTEMAAGSPEPVIAWRGRQRWLQSFEPVRLEAGGPAAPRLRPGGVYVITGGLGGVGHAIARWLAQSAGAKLVLIGRTALPPREEWDGLLARGGAGGDGPLLRKLRRLRDLEEAGAEVLAVQADVTDPVGMVQVRSLALERWGAVHGVIHAAGIPGGGVIGRKDRMAADAVLAPKVQGTLTLAATFPPEELDLFVLCSSLNSVIGAYGQVDYCAANAFLDAFAGSRAGGAGLTIAIAWDAWTEAGMAVETASPGQRRLADGLPAGAEVDHPLLDRRVPAGAGEHAFVTRLDAARHWVLDEHRIQGMPVLPGTAYLELARAAFEQSTGSAAAEIRQATFVAPLAVPDGESRDVYTVLRRQGDGWSFRVASRLEAGGETRWQEHAVGEIGEIASPAPADAGTALPSLPALLAALPLGEPPGGGIGDSEVMSFGPRWSSLRQTAAADGRFLALLRFPDGFDADFGALGLHPAILDRATGFAQWLSPAVDGVYMPFSYSGMRIARPLPADLYSFVRTKQGTAEELCFEVALFDPLGELLVHIDDFAFRRVAPRRADPADIAAAAPAALPAEPVAAAAGPAREGLTTAAGVEALRRLLANADLPQVLVSVRDLPARLAEASALTSQRLLAELDRAGAAAPAGPRHGRPDLATAYVAPRTEAESWLAEIWGDLLGIDAVGIHDDFFELGGDSVLSLRIVARARERGLGLTPGQLFERPTIAGLAAGLGVIAAAEPPAAETVTPPAAPQPVAEGGVYDPANFPDADVSQRDLEALLAQLGGI